MAGTCECGNEPSGSINAGNFLTSCKAFSSSGKTLLHGVSKYQEGVDYDRPLLNLPHVPDTCTVLYDEPAPDFSHRGASPFPTSC